MTPKAQNIINQLDALRAKLGRDLIIVETGTIRNTNPDFEHGDGHSTRFIAEWVKENGGFYTSIDIDCSVAKKYLFDLSLRQYVTLTEANSLDALPRFNAIDFCYLDSANDADNCLAEFLIVWPKITTGGSVMVDDCNEASAELFKGDLLIPYLRERSIPYTQLETNQIIIFKEL